jgi:hypothetical protein
LLRFDKSNQTCDVWVSVISGPVEIGKGSVMVLKEKGVVQREEVSTGSIGLDAA